MAPRTPRKPLGRPVAGGGTPMASARLPGSLRERVDAWRARYEGMTRSTAIRILIGLGLEAHIGDAPLRDPIDPGDSIVVKRRVYRPR